MQFVLFGLEWFGFLPFHFTGFLLLCSLASLLVCIVPFSFASLHLSLFCVSASLLFIFFAFPSFCFSAFFLLFCFSTSFLFASLLFRSSVSFFAFLLFCFCLFDFFPFWLRRLFVFLLFSAFWPSFFFPVLLLSSKYNYSKNNKSNKSNKNNHNPKKDPVQPFLFCCFKVLTLIFWVSLLWRKDYEANEM